MIEGSPALLENKPRRSVGRNIAVLLTSQSVTWALATFVLWIVPRYIDPTAMGRLGVAGSIWVIGTAFCQFGTTTTLTVEVARDNGAAWALAKSTIALRLALFAVVCPSALAVVWLGPYDRTTLVIAVIMAVVNLLNLINAAISSMFVGLQEMGVTAAVDVTLKILTALGTIGVLAVGGRLYGLTAMWCFVAVIGTAMFGTAVRRRIPRPGVPTTLRGRSLLRRSAPFFAAGAVLVMYQQVDTVVMSLLVGEESIGFYSSADILFGSLLFVPLIVMSALFPALAERHHNDPSEARRYLVRVIGPMLTLTVPIGIGTLVSSPTFVPFLYGERYAPTSQVLSVFGVVVIPTGLTIVLGQFALATERARFWALLMLVATALTIPLDMVLVPWADREYHNPAIAGALAYVVTETFLVIVGVAVLARFALTRDLATRAVKIAGAGALGLLAAWPLRQTFFVIPTLVALGVYGAGTLLLGTLSPEEREAIGRGVRAVNGRLRRA